MKLKKRLRQKTLTTFDLFGEDRYFYLIVRTDFFWETEVDIYRSAGDFTRQTDIFSFQTTPLGVL